MTDHNLPTQQERTKLKSLARLRTYLSFAVFLVPGLIMVLFAISRIAPGGLDWPFVIPVVILVTIELGLLVYMSFFLRCPRCSSWKGMVVPKCASCGLKFRDYEDLSESWHPDMPPTQH